MYVTQMDNVICALSSNIFQFRRAFEAGKCVGDNQLRMNEKYNIIISAGEGCL